MFFWLLKTYARLVLRLYCRNVIINEPAWLHAGGPLLIAANHPNSFLDGMILMTIFQKPIYILARGDAFQQKKWDRFLRGLHLLPVYRTSEGVENLTHNYTTFAACQDVFEKKGIVLIFSEGGCVNEWHLRPLRKGTARLAVSAWANNVDLKVVPLGFNYSPFRVWGKTVHLNFGAPLQKKEIINHDTEGKQLLAFNTQLQKQLQPLVYEINADDKVALKNAFFISSAPFTLFILALPAAIGWLVHAPLYFAARAVANHFFDNDHFDAVVVSLLMLVYPLYLLIFIISAGVLFNFWIALAIFFVLPFTAWACLQWKHQFDFS